MTEQKSGARRALRGCGTVALLLVVFGSGMIWQQLRTYNKRTAERAEEAAELREALADFNDIPEGVKPAEGPWLRTEYGRHVKVEIVPDVKPTSAEQATQITEDMMARVLSWIRSKEIIPAAGGVNGVYVQVHLSQPGVELEFQMGDLLEEFENWRDDDFLKGYNSYAYTQYSPQDDTVESHVNEELLK